MAPKKASTSTQARLLATQEDPEEGNMSDYNHEKFAPGLNHLGNLDFDPIVSPPSSRDTRNPARIMRASAVRLSTPRANLVSEK